MTIEGPRLLDKTLLGTLAVMDDSTEIQTLTGSGWSVVPGLPDTAVQREYFDLSGYSLEDLTVFFQGVDLQEPLCLTGNDAAPSIIEIISTEFITDAEILATQSSQPISAPGFSVSTNNMEQIIYGRRRIYYLKQPPTVPVIPFLQSTHMWGTCAASTADKLHITRILVCTTALSATTVPDVNVVVAVVVDKEATLPFIMRQKRSYELATGP